MLGPGQLADVERRTAKLGRTRASMDKALAEELIRRILTSLRMPSSSQRSASGSTTEREKRS
jgi:hypothetical protein